MTTDAVGGVWSHATDLREALADVEFVLAAVGPQAPPDPAVPYLECRLEWQEDPWEDVRRSGEWLLELARGADVVHLNQYAYGALDWPCPVLVAGHSCVLSWHEAVRGAPAGPEWAAYREAVADGLRGADAVVAPSAAMARALERHYGVAARVVHNGSAPGAPARKRDVVLAAGRLWDEAKGLDALDAAAGMAAWPVELAGDTGGARPRHATALGVLGRDELRARMARSAVFAHPARYEPFGLAPLEAASAGCALILGNIPSLRELWDGAALFVPPGDPEALAIAIDLLAGDAPLRTRLAAAARSRALGRTAEGMAGAYRSLYTSLTRKAVAA